MRARVAAALLVLALSVASPAIAQAPQRWEYAALQLLKGTNANGSTTEDYFFQDPRVNVHGSASALFIASLREHYPAPSLGQRFYIVTILNILGLHGWELVSAREWTEEPPTSILRRLQYQEYLFRRPAP